jgi:cyclic pyranopterin phosphate synthase
MIRIPHLETDITQACQLSCVACNHSVPLWRQHGIWSADLSQVERDLNHLATFLHADKWGALGGEPLLHKGLRDILAVARASRVADVIEVWTNGMLLRRQPDEFWTAEWDHLVVSIYPGKLTDEDIEWIKQRCESAGKVFSPRDERVNPNFRTMLEPAPTNPAITQRKFAGCFFRHFSRCASYGYFFTCCCGPHIPMLIQGQPYGTDGVKIEGLTEADLRAYLDRTEPLAACTVCAGRDTAVAIAWREERHPLLWQKASAGL